jgi:hypothetical protein
MNIDKYTSVKDILLISPSQAYEWVKTGHWCLTEFTIWFEIKNEDSFEVGYSNCLEE